MKKMTISEDMKKYVFLILTVAILVLAFIFYKNNMSQKTQIETEMVDMDNQIRQLRSMESQKVQKEAETQEFDTKCQQILAELPAEITDEKGIYVLHQMADKSELVINSIKPTMNQVFYEKEIVPVATTAASATPAPDVSASPTPTPIAAKSADGTIDYSTMTGYCGVFEITFTSTFEQLTKAVSFIVDNPERMTLGDMTVAFDAMTGNLTGTMVITMYAVTNNTVPYVAPDVSSYKTGVDNIFGTFEKKE